MTPKPQSIIGTADWKQVLGDQAGFVQAVVVKSIPPGESWGGNPAKFIRKLKG